MSNWNHYRRCAKCGKTRAEDMSVSYHRFPKPGKTNIIRASAWAKYCYPTKDWTSLEFLQSLYSQNKVLCGRHFHSSQFYDNMRQKLTKFAVPDSDEIQEFLNRRENILSQDETQPAISTQQTVVAVKNICEVSSIEQIVMQSIAGQSKLFQPIENETTKIQPESMEEVLVTGACSEQNTILKKKKKYNILKQLNEIQKRSSGKSQI